jgi:aryl-alcohol dehydrogenase-like predicted oxidoreductase
MLPIPGTGNLQHLEENAGAARLNLSPQDMRDLD